MLFSNELNYWVIKKNAKKYLLLRMGRHIRTYPIGRMCRFVLVSEINNCLVDHIFEGLKTFY
ncbi:hypothetical protein [Leptospira borgpetersenii]|uniref:hypothetical protein n=1 Tax=Leptospira borgpetersenii TaxID=174 RepID=UPI001A02B3D7|nr:hypothetical protein [Leptospira borgpetersenii]MBE8435446.1 hypothetical protein [Leptospira borgpetersenii serovar Tarassovi]UVA64219.1 hypothetical protein LH336_00260 [Leptospira borgpetersenii]